MIEKHAPGRAVSAASLESTAESSSRGKKLPLDASDVSTCAMSLLRNKRMSPTVKDGTITSEMPVAAESSVAVSPFLVQIFSFSTHNFSFLIESFLFLMQNSSFLLTCACQRSAPTCNHSRYLSSAGMYIQYRDETHHSSELRRRSLRPFAPPKSIIFNTEFIIFNT